jgi:hypothetical protein
MVTGLSVTFYLFKTIRKECSGILNGNLTSFLINKQQCLLLFKKLLETEKTLKTLKTIQDKLSHEDTTSSGFPNVGPATQELVHVLKAAHKTILKDCLCNDRWMESALIQGGDLKETFAQILYDLQWYVLVLCNIFLEWTF